jgi:hypothetical protein
MFHHSTPSARVEIYLYFCMPCRSENIYDRNVECTGFCRIRRRKVIRSSLCCLMWYSYISPGILCLFNHQHMCSCFIFAFHICSYSRSIQCKIRCLSFERVLDKCACGKYKRGVYCTIQIHINTHGLRHHRNKLIKQVCVWPTQKYLFLILNNVSFIGFFTVDTSRVL